MHRSVPAHAHHLSNATGVRAIRFDRHGREGRLHMSGLKQHDIKAGSNNTSVEPLRERPGLQADRDRRGLQELNELHQNLRLAWHLKLAADLSITVAPFACDVRLAPSPDAR